MTCKKRLRASASFCFVYRVCLSQRASDQIHIPDLLDRTINWSIACKGITCSETAASSYFLCYLKLMVSKDSVKDVSSGKYYHSLESHISCTVLTFFFFFPRQVHKVVHLLFV